MEVDIVVGDTAYSGKENIVLSHDELNGFELVSKLNSAVSQGVRKESEQFEFNKDARMFVCLAGHMAVCRVRQGKKNESTNQVHVYYFDIEKCKTCSRQEGCYKEGAKSKYYSVFIKSNEHQQQMAFEQTDEFRKKAKVRYRIEAKNAELKHVFGYDRAESYGLDCIHLQGTVAIFAANIRRILKLI